jgi:hypothetical protein
MQTECIAQQFEFEGVERRAVVAAFDGGHVTSDAGVLLLSQLDHAMGLIERFAGCFVDKRDPELIEHSVQTLLGQRVLGLALGYEDLIDHDQLRHDRLLGCGAREAGGEAAQRLRGAGGQEHVKSAGAHAAPPPLSQDRASAESDRETVCGSVLGRLCEGASAHCA